MVRVRMSERHRGPRPFVFVLHNHQPVGNFGHVFEDAFARCYRPVVELMAQFPSVSVGLHFTGPLLEWIAKEQEPFVQKVRELVEEGRVEILGGGFYEPILSVLPDQDARGQVHMMADFCEHNFGVRPEGIWLAERVWDPDLPRVLAPSGVRYTLLDDSHFHAAGEVEDVISGYYLTEKAGHAMAILPIDKGLRYRIPFAMPEEVLAYIENAPGTGCLTYGDDGEKFGVWPNTYEWVYEKKWLELFFRQLSEAEAQGRVQTVLPGAYVRQNEAHGRIYLPNASYEEMMEWALPLAGMKRLEQVRSRLKNAGASEREVACVRGGIWQSFLAKYPEANQIHKKMLLVSERLERAAQKIEGRSPDERTLKRLENAKRALYQGQCCCAYWHGLFGGLYLNYLRSALYRSLLSAERELDTLAHGETNWIASRQTDFDLDGHDEVLLGNRLLNVYVQPHRGGTVFEIDDKARAFHLTDVLTRREEAYHRHLFEGVDAAPGDHSGAPKTIHDGIQFKVQGLERDLVYDDRSRASFVDRFLVPGTPLDRVREGRAYDQGDFSCARYRHEPVNEDGARGFLRLNMWRVGRVTMGDRTWPVRVDKELSMHRDKAGVGVRYTVQNQGEQPLEVDFATELNLTLLAGNDRTRHLLINKGDVRFLLGSEGLTEHCRSVDLVDEWLKLRANFGMDEPGRLYRYPVETVSQSEQGLERTYQGTCFLCAWPLRVAPGEKRHFNFWLHVGDLEETLGRPW